MKNLVLMFFLISFKTSICQDTVFYDNLSNTVKSIDLADSYELKYYDKTDSNVVSTRVYLKTGELIEEKNYSNYRSKTIDGKYKVYFKNGQLKKEINYNIGKLNGNLLTFWDNGNPKRVDVYKDNILLIGKCYDYIGNEIPFFKYEQFPEFPGGEQALFNYLKKKVQYPYNLIKEGKEGEVVVGFTINKIGSPTNVHVIKGCNNEFDQEAIRVIRCMTLWKPGKLDGEYASVFYSIPIKFFIQPR